MKQFFEELLEIIFTLFVAIFGAFQDLVQLIAETFSDSKKEYFITISDGKTQSDIPVSRLDEFILDEGSSKTAEQLQVMSYPLMDALDFSDCPSEKEVATIVPGSKVLLVSNNESFWVGVTRVVDGMYEGLIEGDPSNNGYHKGNTIEFASHHVFQIYHTAQQLKQNDWQIKNDKSSKSQNEEH